MQQARNQDCEKENALTNRSREKLGVIKENKNNQEKQKQKEL